jgi:hypothetical protein
LFSFNEELFLICVTHNFLSFLYSFPTGYGLDGTGNESRWGRDFPHPSSPALGPTKPPFQWVPGLSRGVKQPGCGVDHPHPSIAEVKERVGLYLYSLSAFVACYRVTFTFTFIPFIYFSRFCVPLPTFLLKDPVVIPFPLPSYCWSLLLALQILVSYRLLIVPFNSSLSIAVLIQF